MYPIPKIARTLFNSESTKLELDQLQILKIEPLLATSPKLQQLSSMCIEKTQSFSENTSDILSQEINHEGLQSHLNQVSSGPSSQYNQLLRDNCTANPPKEENLHSTKILFTPRLIGTRINFEDDDRQNTLKKETVTKSMFVPNVGSGTVLTSLINQESNLQQYSKNSFDISFKQSPKDQLDIIDIDTPNTNSIPLIFNLPRFTKDYIILEVCYQISFC